MGDNCDLSCESLIGFVRENEEILVMYTIKNIPSERTPKQNFEVVKSDILDPVCSDNIIGIANIRFCHKMYPHAQIYAVLKSCHKYYHDNS